MPPLASAPRAATNQGTRKNAPIGGHGDKEPERERERERETKMVGERRGTPAPPHEPDIQESFFSSIAVVADVVLTPASAIMSEPPKHLQTQVSVTTNTAELHF